MVTAGFVTMAVVVAVVVMVNAHLTSFLLFRACTGARMDGISKGHSQR